MRQRRDGGQDNGAPRHDVLLQPGNRLRRINAERLGKTVAGLSRPGSQMLILAGNTNEARHYGPQRIE